MKTIGEMKKEVSMKIIDMTKELKEILDNLEDEEKVRMLEVMNDCENADYPILYDIDEFDEILSKWTPSDIMMNTSQELFENFDCVTSFYIDNSGLVRTGDDYLETYYFVFDVERFISRNNYNVTTDIDSVDYWEEKYQNVINFQDELNSFDNNETFNEEDYKYYEDFKEVKEND